MYQKLKLKIFFNAWWERLLRFWKLMWQQNLNGLDFDVDNQWLIRFRCVKNVFQDFFAKLAWVNHQLCSARKSSFLVREITIISENILFTNMKHISKSTCSICNIWQDRSGLRRHWVNRVTHFSIITQPNATVLQQSLYITATLSSIHNDSNASWKCSSPSRTLPLN